MRKRTFLFNPVGVVHDRHIKLFENVLNDSTIRRIYNPKYPWFAKQDRRMDGVYFFMNDRVPDSALAGLDAIICFNAQPRFPVLDLLTQAAFRSIPVIAIEEVYQLILEQGYVNEYFLPVDHLFAASDHEKAKFVGIGVSEDVVEVTGCPFRYSNAAHKVDKESKALKAAIGCVPGKPIVTLSLAYLTPSGETLDLRKKLLSMAQQGVTPDCELVVKPHPGERDNGITDFIKAHAPLARVVHPHTPIDRVLDITDILLNRGNSQVLINALDRKIPVILIPLGRPTLFDGLIDEMVANSPSDIRRIKGLISTKGFDIYKPVYDRYLSIGPEKAVTNVSMRMIDIAEERSMYKPAARLQELALFWAWQGFAGEAIKIIERLKSDGVTDRACLNRISRLISHSADEEDMSLLRKWAGSGYMKWIIQSLWVRTLYLKLKVMGERDREWFKDFPPRMNRHHFLPFAFMLGHCYLRAGYIKEAESLGRHIASEYSYVKGRFWRFKTVFKEIALAASRPSVYRNHR